MTDSRVPGNAGVSGQVTEFFRSPINWFFIFVPITIVLERVGGIPRLEYPVTSDSSIYLGLTLESRNE